MNVFNFMINRSVSPIETVKIAYKHKEFDSDWQSIWAYDISDLKVLSVHEEKTAQYSWLECLMTMENGSRKLVWVADTFIEKPKMFDLILSHLLN